MPRALITGVGGQDGSYLAELLTDRGYDVHGTSAGGDPVVPLPVGVIVHRVDQRESEQLRRLVLDLRPDEVYNLAAVSSVGASWSEPVLAAQVNGLGAVTVLDSCWQLREHGHRVRVVQASSAEIFGAPTTTPQREDTPLRPTNPYGASKTFAHQMVSIYRARGLHASAAILYNHESPRRGHEFVTRKITSTVAAISVGRAHELVLGNQEARRDWGWAPDVADALARMGQAAEPDDYVIATGVSHSVRDFVAAAFAAVGIEDWAGLVRSSPEFYRPTDATELVGDPSRARQRLGWSPTLAFPDIVAALVRADLKDIEV